MKHRKRARRRTPAPATNESPPREMPPIPGRVTTLADQISAILKGQILQEAAAASALVFGETLFGKGGFGRFGPPEEGWVTDFLKDLRTVTRALLEKCAEPEDTEANTVDKETIQ